MNDAKGHASNLLILSLATALVGAGILSWSLAQSNLFKERPRTASSLAIKNTVSESIMTNEPVQNPIEIKIPDIKTGQATNPDEVAKKPDVTDAIIEEPKEARSPVTNQATEPTKYADKAAPNEITTQEQKPEIPVEETILAEKIIPPDTFQNEIAAETTAPEAATAETILPEVAQDEITALTPEADTEVVPIETALTPSPEAPQTEEVRSTTETSATEAIPSATPQDEIVAAITITDADTAEVPKSEITVTATETSTVETSSPQVVQNEVAPTITEAATEVIPAEIPPEDTVAASEILPNTETPEETDQASAASPDEDTQVTERKKDGWIYAGLYEEGKWTKRGLELPADKLPDAGNIYKLIWGTNVRVAPPGKRTANGDNLANNIDYLAVNREIEVTSIKNSGNSGHIWLEIKY